MVRLLVFSRTDGAVTAAALVIVGLGEGTGIAEAEPVACRRDRKCAAEAVAVTAGEGGQFARQQSFARLGAARCQGFNRTRADDAVSAHAYRRHARDYSDRAHRLRTGVQPRGGLSLCAGEVSRP